MLQSHSTSLSSSVLLLISPSLCLRLSISAAPVVVVDPTEPATVSRVTTPGPMPMPAPFVIGLGVLTPPTSPHSEIPPVLSEAPPTGAAVAPTQKGLSLTLPMSPPNTPPATLRTVGTAKGGNFEDLFHPDRAPFSSAASTGSGSDPSCALGIVLGEYFAGGYDGESDEDEDGDGHAYGDEDEDEDEVEIALTGVQHASLAAKGSYFPSFPPVELEFPAEIEHELRALRLVDEGRV